MSPERRAWEDERPNDPHIWRTLGYRRTAVEHGLMRVEWDASEDYCFPSGDDWIVHGGMVATLLDTAMGGACWSVLDPGETFLTADLRVEFFRAGRPGLLRAEGRVLHKTRRVAFCGGSLEDGDGVAIASARCTQIIRAKEA